MGDDIIDDAIRANDTSTLELVNRSLDADKAIEPLVISLGDRTTIADHMVVATGTSQRHIAAMAENLLDRLKAEHGTAVQAEGLQDGGSSWVLIDAGEVIVHLFRAETRAFYDLEKLWAAAPLRPAAATG